jgi:misacylated tRNA(Ala) deacylase
MKAIYLEDSYIRSFHSFVEAASDNSVCLNATAFYPESGGQPSDLGIISRDAEQFKVLKVEPADGRILHHLDREGLEPGDQVFGSVDWERRYRFMRSPTACHILECSHLPGGPSQDHRQSDRPAPLKGRLLPGEL